MDKSTLEKAKKIESEIEYLKEENNLLLCVGAPYGCFFESFKKLVLRRNCTNGLVILTEDDAKAMIELRKKRIAELEKELEQL